MPLTAADLLDLSGAILASVGSAAAIFFGLSSWLGKVWANRILTKEKQKYAEDLEAFKSGLALAAESYKMKLKKSELIFAKEFDAASSLVALLRDISPRVSRPDMDWHDACDEMASAFGSIEHQLKAYLRDHGAILPDDAKELITKSFGLAGQFKFGDGTPEVSPAANNAATQMFESLAAAESKMVLQVRSQVAT